MNLGYIMIVIAMLIWGSVGLVVRVIDQSPEVIVFFRVFIAFITISLINLYNKREKQTTNKISKSNVVILVLGGVFLSLNWMFFFKAIKSTTVASATLSYYTAPVVVTILSYYILKEKISKRTFIAITLSFTGILIMVLNQEAAHGGFSPYGVGYGLIAAVFYALVTITGKKLEGVYSYKIVMIQTGISSLIFLPVLRGMRNIDLSTIIALIVLGTIHTSIALTIYFEGIKRVKVQHVGILSYIDPLSAVIFAFIFLGEIPDIYTLTGGSLIIVSTYIILRKK